MNAPSMRFIYGGSAVKRYHTVRVLNDDTVAQHSFGVAWLCYALCDEAGCSSSLIMSALAHDLAEQFTGDLPAPAKRQLKIGEQFRVYEKEIEANNDTNFCLTEREHRILKLADNMDGVARCRIEINMGNTYAAVPLANYLSYLLEMNLTRHEESVLQQVNNL